MANIPPFSANILEELAKFFGNIHSHSAIEMILRNASLFDPGQSFSKWKRLYNAFADSQKKYNVSNNVIKYICLALDPVCYTQNKTQYMDYLSRVNRILAFVELEFREDGKMHRVTKDQTLSEAVLRAQKLKSLLEQRKTHPDILKAAEAEIASDNYFHTVLEAMKSVTSKIRSLTGIYADGAELIDLTLSGANPCLAINHLKTKSEIGEQKGFANLLKGLYGTFRNPTAHEPKIEWPVSEDDALDVLSVLSYVHRKLDNARRI